MSEEPAVRGVLVAHGAMAEGLVGAVRKVAGDKADALVALSNDGLSRDELCRRLDEASGKGPTVIFADLQAGSCALAGRVSCGHQPTRALVSGVNLPMLLDFVFNNRLPLDELVTRLLAKAKDAIQPFERAPAPPLHADSTASD